MRDDYAETGRREDDTYKTFPFSKSNPIVVIGIVKGNKGIFKEVAHNNSRLRQAIQEAKTQCKRGSIELIGAWPGKWSTDFFQLNLKFFEEQ